MGTIKGTILRQDILETKYTNSNDCAITRALKRISPDGHDSGTYMECNGTTLSICYSQKNYNQQYKELAYKVIGMYIGEGKLEGDKRDSIYPVQSAEDFEFEINY